MTEKERRLLLFVANLLREEIRLHESDLGKLSEYMNDVQREDLARRHP